MVRRQAGVATGGGVQVSPNGNQLRVLIQNLQVDAVTSAAATGEHNRHRSDYRPRGRTPHGFPSLGSVADPTVTVSSHQTLGKVGAQGGGFGGR